MLDVRRMKVLREVAAKGSFSAAAEALNFTQSAVSQHIAALERETGTQLVERFSRGVRLTEAGTVLVTHADAILARLESAEEDLAAHRRPARRAAPARVLPERRGHRGPQGGGHLPRAPPRRGAEPARGGARRGRGAPEAGDVDLALVYDHPATMLMPDLELTHLLDDSYDALLPVDHRLAERRRLSLADLSADPWILSTSGCGCRQITQSTCRDAGFEPRVAFEADETLAAQALVAAGRGRDAPAANGAHRRAPGHGAARAQGRAGAGGCSPRAWRVASTRPRATRCSRSSGTWPTSSAARASSSRRASERRPG